MTFRVEDMTCGQCASRITRAVTSLDSAAQVEVNILRKLVRISSSAPDSGIVSALAKAGYTARRVEDVPAAEPKQGSGGCCCASRTPAAGREVAAKTSCCAS